MHRTISLSTGVLAITLAACSSSGSSTKPETAPAPGAAPAAAPAGPAAAPASAAAPSSGASGSVAGDTVVTTEILINVINNRIPPTQITVFAIGPSIGRIILGNVSNGQTKAFTFKAGNLNGDYYLIAQGAGGNELRSRVFNLTPTLRFVQWSLDVNSIVQYQTPQ